MSAKGPPQGGIFVGVYIYWSGVVARVVVRTHIDICFGDSFHYPRDNTKIKIEVINNGIDLSKFPKRKIKKTK
jgi:hypothetical protein